MYMATAKCSLLSCRLGGHVGTHVMKVKALLRVSRIQGILLHLRSRHGSTDLNLMPARAPWVPLSFLKMPRYLLLCCPLYSKANAKPAAPSPSRTPVATSSLLPGHFGCVRLSDQVAARVGPPRRCWRAEAW